MPAALAWVGAAVAAASSARRAAGAVVAAAAVSDVSSSPSCPSFSRFFSSSSSPSSSSEHRRGPSAAAAAAAAAAEEAARLADLTAPALWFPVARSSRRRIIAHVGPTNSGKTHAALEALAAARSGSYCGPLRLLAAEVAERLAARGVPCDYVTGQEQRRVEGARHVAATAEMADLEAPVEVAVVDEVQMIACPSRGPAFTRALLGLPARELHVCGDASALPLLRRLAADCGDDLEESTYRRLSRLVVQREPVGSLRAVRSGDCVVAFGRRELHRLRAAIAATPPPPEDGGGGGRGGGPRSQSRSPRSLRRVGLLYGALPPAARRSQAALFDAGAAGADGDSRSGCDVLVASDAVGMGVNLRARRVVFSTLEKWDGAATRPLLPAEVRQIAGRAGRFSGGHPEGYVACLDPADVPRLIAAMRAPPAPLAAARLLPSPERLLRWHAARRAAATAAAAAAAEEEADATEGTRRTRGDGKGPKRSRAGAAGRRRNDGSGAPPSSGAAAAAAAPPTLADSLEALAAEAQLRGAHYALGDTANAARLARLLEPLGLEDGDLAAFASSPTDARDPASVAALAEFASAFARRRRVPAAAVARFRVPRSPPPEGGEEAALRAAEGAHRVAELYCWLAGRLPGAFPGRAEAQEARDRAAEAADDALRRLSLGAAARGGRGGGGGGRRGRAQAAADDTEQQHQQHQQQHPQTLGSHAAATAATAAAEAVMAAAAAANGEPDDAAPGRRRRRAPEARGR